MTSKPIHPGRMYRVTGHGLDLTVRAATPCDALIVALTILEARAA